MGRFLLRSSTKRFVLVLLWAKPIVNIVLDTSAAGARGRFDGVRRPAAPLSADQAENHLHGTVRLQMIYLFERIQ